MGKQKTELEIRSLQEVRSIGEDGTFEGYIAVWDTVDSYDSTFKRGAFAKTIQESGSRVKVFFNHEELVGRSISITEDDYGVHVRGQLTMAVQRSRDVYEFMKDKTLDGLSFGFRTIKERFASGVREILEVRLYEYGPVMFPANDAAVITDVRAERILAMSQSKPKNEGKTTETGKPGEERATDFNETVMRDELARRGGRLMNALWDTLDDIWWGNDDAGSIPGLVDDAISTFHAAYLEWVNEYIAYFWSAETRSAPGGNALAHTFNAYLTAEEGRSIESVAAATSFTADELNMLKRGKPIANRDKLSELPEEVRAAHRSIRTEAVETLLSELRAGFSPAETRRVQALLQPASEERQEQSEPEAENMLSYLTDFRKSLNEGHENA